MLTDYNNTKLSPVCDAVHKRVKFITAEFKRRKMMKKRILCMLLALVMLVSAIGVLASCKKDDNTDACASGHVDKNKDNKCDVCKKVIDESVCTSHKDSDEDGKCDKCGKKMGEEEVFNYPWEETTLLFKMTHNSHRDELSSTCGRYLAGEYDGATDDLDDLVLERNEKAYQNTKVKVTYDYYDQSDDYGWGMAVEDIVEVILAGGDGVPDVYCNFFYDLASASLNGVFANLRSETLGTNYFEFNDDDYLEDGQENPDPTKDRGYMYEYMRSTTLSRTQMYILASDYFTDMVRAFFIVPVNIALLESVGENITGDLNGDGEFTLEDFYEDVKRNNWTYDLVAEYASAVSTMGGTVQTLEDTIGFALEVGGLSGSGILYSTPITIVGRTWDPDTNDYEYYYPEENEPLYEMVDNLKNLFDQPGVIAVTGSTEVDKKYGSTALLAIRNRFCDNYVLFGGIECVGALEEPQYQNLKTGTGFGVVPVPLYKEIEEGSTTTYLTSIHNVGRPGAISRTTKNFAQVSAFLNYQSTHSDEILETYYQSRLQYGATDGNTGTVEMLDFIRNNVRTSFDKTMEDAIGYKYDVSKEKWHAILVSANYSTDIRASYKAYIANKQANLAQLQADFANFPK